MNGLIQYQSHDIWLYADRLHNITILGLHISMNNEKRKTWCRQEKAKKHFSATSTKHHQDCRFIALIIQIYCKSL